MEQLDQNDVEMGHLPPENNGNDPKQVPLLNQPAETRDSPESRRQKRHWTCLATIKANRKIKYGVIVISVIVVIAIIIIPIGCVRSVGGNGSSNQLARNSSQEVGTDNTTANWQTMGNQTMYHLCSKGISDFAQPGQFVCKYDPLDREKIIYFIAGWKMTFFEANKYCKEKGGQLLTLEDPNTLEALRPFLKDVFYWFDAVCAPSEAGLVWKRTDGSLFHPNLYNASSPFRNRESCGTFESSGKIKFEMCKDINRFICKL